MNGEKVTLSIRLEKGVVSKLREAAKKEDRSLNYLIAAIVKNKIKEKGL